MQKNMILAIVLSILFIILWNRFYKQKEIQPEPDSTATVSNEPAKQPDFGILSEEVPLSKEFLYETKNFNLVFDSIGGGLRNIQLKNFSDISNKPVDLLGPKLVYESAFSLSGDKAFYDYYQKDKSSIFIRKHSNEDIFPSNLYIEKEFVFNTNSYLFEVIFRFQNKGNNNIIFPEEKRFFKTGFSLKIPVSKKNQQYNQPVVSFCKAGNMFHVNSRDKINKKYLNMDFAQSYEWIALADRYFILSMVLSDRVRLKRPVFYAKNDIYSVYIEEKMPEILKPKESISFRYFIYAGPKDRDIFRIYIKEYKDATGLISFEQAMGFNKIFGPIANLLLDILTFLQRIVKSYGLSIILLTILIKIVFFPLTFKQYESMIKMKDIQPQLNALKEKYKNDPQSLNKETMELYKKYKINPLGGCLPMLIQIPVFFAFYDLLAKSVKLRGVSFLWIKDLANPDTVAIIAGFSLNILPLLMSLSMILQQSLSTGGDPQQKKMMMIMSVFFLFIFWNLPAGLTLYWTCQNILGLLEQLVIQTWINNKKVS